jgi:hypothetical protein
MNKLRLNTAGLLALPSFCLALFAFSFSVPFGGEGFEVYVNNKLVLQQFGKEMNNIRTLGLSKQGQNSEVTVKYYHCGQSGKNRELSIRNNQNRVLMKWTFADGAVMKFSLTELRSLHKAEGETLLSLYYACGEKPRGQKLVQLTTGSGSQAGK